jgi:hypothetical protein
MFRWGTIIAKLGFKVGYGSKERMVVDENGSLTPKDVTIAETRSGAGSYQSVAADLTLSSAAGTSTAGSSDFLAAAMGNVIGANMTKTNNYVAGVIGAYSVTGTQASTYPTAGVLGIVSDGVTDVDGAVVGVVDGDSAVTRAPAVFKARMRNSTPGSGADFGLDLYDPAEGAYKALEYAKSDIRMSNEVCVLSGAGAPTDGGSGTGAGFAGPCSLYLDRTNVNVYLNAGSKASPTWKLMTRAV